MPAIASHDTPVVDEPWDAGANVGKIKTPVTKAVAQHEWAWRDPNSPDTDGDDGWPDAKDGYRFPHHMVDGDGTPGDANRNACSNGLARLENSKIPEADKAGVRAHLQHHLDAFNKKQAAARAEQFAASVADHPTPVADAAAQETVEPGFVAAGFSDLDLVRSGAPLEMLLGKPWAITREAAIEVATNVAMRAQGRYRSDEQFARLQAAARPAASVSPQPAGNVAVIPLRGTITPRGSLFSLIFGGGGGLQQFREMFRQAMADSTVSSVVIDIDSPGGLIDLVPETTAEILNARGTKPITAVANTTCASAAYWIASAADTVVATPSAQVGSIGVFTMHEDFSRAEQMMGIKTTLVSAGQFKTEGNPYEPLSKQAQAALQAEVNELYGMFTSQIAEGRGVSQAAVQAGYGKGRCLLADQAYKVGMVDRIETLEQTVARLGGQITAPVDPELEPGDLCDDTDLDDGPVAEETSPEPGVEKRGVSAPLATNTPNYLNPPWGI